MIEFIFCKLLPGLMIKFPKVVIEKFYLLIFLFGGFQFWLMVYLEDKSFIYLYFVYKINENNEL